MKMKLLLFIIVVVLCSSMFVFMSINNMNSCNVLSLVNVESLANDEIVDETHCMEIVASVDIKYQECSVYDKTYETIYRRDIVYECNGTKGSGSCNKGHVYQYYDCDDYYISSNDQTRRTACEGKE